MCIGSDEFVIGIPETWGGKERDLLMPWEIYLLARVLCKEWLNDMIKKYQVPLEDRVKIIYPCPRCTVWSKYKNVVLICEKKLDSLWVSNCSDHSLVQYQGIKLFLLYISFSERRWEIFLKLNYVAARNWSSVWSDQLWLVEIVLTNWEKMPSSFHSCARPHGRRSPNLWNLHACNINYESEERWENFPYKVSWWRRCASLWGRSFVWRRSHFVTHDVLRKPQEPA